MGPGGGQISRVVHVSTRADFGVFAEKCGFVQAGHTFPEKVWLLIRGAHFYRNKNGLNTKIEEIDKGEIDGFFVLLICSKCWTSVFW